MSQRKSLWGSGYSGRDDWKHVSNASFVGIRQCIVIRRRFMVSDETRRQPRRRCGKFANGRQTSECQTRPSQLNLQNEARTAVFRGLWSLTNSLGVISTNCRERPWRGSRENPSNAAMNLEVWSRSWQWQLSLFELGGNDNPPIHYDSGIRTLKCVSQK